MTCEYTASFYDARNFVREKKGGAMPSRCTINYLCTTKILKNKTHTCEYTASPCNARNFVREKREEPCPHDALVHDKKEKKANHTQASIWPALLMHDIL